MLQQTWQEATTLLILMTEYLINQTAKFFPKKCSQDRSAGSLFGKLEVNIWHGTDCLGNALIKISN